MAEIGSRITGTEMEWPLMVRRSSDVYFEQAESSVIQRAYALLERGNLTRAGTNGMLSNGGRLYIDIGEHPEYATPEDDSFIGTVANEIAGEKIVYDVMLYAQNKQIIKDFILTKRVVDDELHTMGYHISLCADADKVKINEQSLTPLGSHLATIALLTGAGAVIPNQDGVRYVVAQKSLNLSSDFSQSSHDNNNPLISLRDEHHVRDKKYTRVHITSLDSNISPWATWMKLGTTSIVLRMMETGYWHQNTIQFEDPMYTIASRVANDPDLKEIIKLDNRKTIRPLDVQYETLSYAKKMADDPNVGMPEEEMRVLSEWERALSDLAIDPERLVDRADWVLRRKTLERYMAKNSLVLSDIDVIKTDRQWSRMGPAGIGRKFREASGKGRNFREALWKEWMPQNEAIERAYYNAPTTTRALARAAFIQKYSHKNYALTVDWGGARAVRDGSSTSYIFDDPYRNTFTSKTKSEKYVLYEGPIEEQYDDEDDNVPSY